jgi:arginine exporter protein ArgO
MSQSMHHQNLWRAVVCSLCSGLLLGCATAPVQEMSDARQAVAAAVQAGGEQRLPTQMQAARAALSQAEVALRNRQFKQARSHAEQAHAQAIAVQQLINAAP